MGKKSRTKYAAINVITGVGGQLLTILLQFVVRTVFIHTLGKSYLGLNGIFSNILSMLSLAELGISSAITFRLYRPLAEHDTKQVRILVKFYRLAYLLIGVVIFLFGIVLIPFLPWFIKDYDSLQNLGINATLFFLIYLMRSVSSYLFLAYRSTVIIADQKKYILDLVKYTIDVVTSILEIVVLVVFKNFLIYTLIAVFTIVAESLVKGIIVKKKYPEYFVPEKESLNKTEIKLMLQDCGALFVYKVNGVVIKASDTLVLSAFMGTVVVGLYSNYMLIYRAFVSLLSRVFNAFRASMGNLFVTESMEKKYLFFRVVNFLTALLYGTVGIGIAVCVNEVIIAWLGTEYMLEQPIPILIGIETFFDGVLMNLGQVRGVSGVFRQAWYRPLFGIMVNIVASIVFVQFWGIAGVIMGTISAYVLTNFLIEPALIYKFTFKNYKPVWDYYRDNIKYILVCVSVYVMDMLICNHFFVGYGWLSVIVHVMITGASIPVSFVLLFRRTDECRYLLNLIRKIGKKVKKRRSRST